MTKDINKIIKQKSGLRLDIGGGGNPEGPDWVNIDYRPLPEVDIVHDLETFPWPLPDESVNVAVCKHVMEHINPSKGIFINFVNEVWRVLKYGSQIAIVVPYAGSTGDFQDPTHVNHLNENTFSYFDPLDSITQHYLYSIYEPAPFEIETRSWSPNGNLQVVMKKRYDDKSYHSDGKIHWGNK